MVGTVSVVAFGTAAARPVIAAVRRCTVLIVEASATDTLNTVRMFIRRARDTSIDVTVA